MHIEAAPADAMGCSACRVLIVDRDPESSKALQERLVQAGFAVTFDSGGHTFLATVAGTRPHLVVLDWNLPGARAVALLRQLQRVEPRERPRLLVISEPCEEQEVLGGFDRGVDDFVLKPYSLAEVVARVRAILRPRLPGAQIHVALSFRDLRVEPHLGHVLACEQLVSLRRLEFRLLHFLLQHTGRVFTREQLLAHIWGHGCADARAVDVTVQRTRRALMRHGCAGYLQTVRGVGYRVSAPAA